MNLSVIVITNKKTLNKLFLDSLKFADEIIVEYSVKITNFADKRNTTLSKAKGNWVLFVDDDEIISRELAREIKEKINDTNKSGYYLKRVDLVFNKEIKNGEQKNQKILRLAKKDAGKFTRAVHEVWEINGQLGSLKNYLYHTKNNFVSEFISKISTYGPLDAKSLDGEQKHFNLFRLLCFPGLKFINNYFLKLGLLDGIVGIFYSYFMSIQSLSVRVFQWENQRQQS